MDEADKRTERTDTRTAAAGGPAGWGFRLPERWELQRLLAVGGQAEVWLALDRQVGELVAVKIFHPAVSPTALERLRREVRLGRSLQHPNLVRIYELIEAGGRLALAMEWLPRGSVAAMLQRDGPRAVDDVVAVAGQVLDALEHLHAHGIVHRDLKPSNLLLDAEGRVKVGDLGLVKVLDGGERLTQTAMAVGSPGYMSPEQIRGQELTPASDLYSLGVTLYELLTGARPFAGPSDFDVAHAQVEHAPPNPRRLRPDCPRWLALFIMRLLERCASDRFPNAGAALEAFHHRQWCASGRAWRRRLAIAAGLAVLLGVALFVSGPVMRLWERAATVRADGSSLQGLAANGQVLWNYDCGATITQLERADLDGDGENETIVAAVPSLGIGERAANPRHSEVLILDGRGHLEDRFQPDQMVERYMPNQIAPPLFVPRLFLADLDGDGHPNLIVNCRHRSLGTAALFGSWGRTRSWEFLLSHPGGWIYHLAIVPGAHPPRLRFLAFNSLIGSHVVAGELAVGDPAQGPIGGHQQSHNGLWWGVTRLVHPARSAGHHAAGRRPARLRRRCAWGIDVFPAWRAVHG